MKRGLYVEEKGTTSGNTDRDSPSSLFDFGIELYMDEVKSIPTLSYEQTVDLFQALEEKKRSYEESMLMKKRGPEQLAHERSLARDVAGIKNRLVTHNLKLVVYLAHRYQGRGVSIQDLVQEGNIGLIHSIDKFDYRLGYRFSTYATYWIRQALLTAIYQQSGPVRVPVHVHEKLRTHERKADQPKRGEHRKRNGTPYSGISTKKRQDLLQLKELMKEPLPLEAQTMHEGLDLMEVTRDETQPSPEDRVVVQDLTEKLHAALATLTQREEVILRLRYGIDSPESLTLEEVGRLFKLTKERIRQIESKALKRLSTTMAPATGAAA